MTKPSHPAVRKPIHPPRFLRQTSLSNRAVGLRLSAVFLAAVIGVASLQAQAVPSMQAAFDKYVKTWAAGGDVEQIGKQEAFFREHIGSLTPVLARELESKSDERRERALMIVYSCQIRTLGHAALRHAESDPSETVRFSAIQALGKLHVQYALKFLGSMVDKGDRLEEYPAFVALYYTDSGVAVKKFRRKIQSGGFRTGDTKFDCTQNITMLQFIQAYNPTKNADFVSTNLSKVSHCKDNAYKLLRAAVAARRLPTDVPGP